MQLSGTAAARHMTLLRKHHVGMRLHKSWFSLESLLLEHHISHTKFSKKKIIPEYQAGQMGQHIRMNDCKAGEV